jgi:predicted small secreted protein
MQNATRDFILGAMLGVMLGWTVIMSFIAPEIISSIKAIANEIKQLDR